MQSWTFANSHCKMPQECKNIRAAIPIKIKSPLIQASTSRGCSPSLCTQFLQNSEVEELAPKNLCHDCIKTTGFEGYSPVCCVFQPFAAIRAAATSAGTMAPTAAVSGLTT